MKNSKKIIFIFSAVILVILVIVNIIFSSRVKLENDDFYTVADQKFASFKTAVGYREIINFDEHIQANSSRLIINYKSDNSQDDAQKYMDYLIKNEGFRKYNEYDFNIVEVRKNIDGGRFLEVCINYYPDSFEMQILVKYGKLE